MRDIVREEQISELEPNDSQLGLGNSGSFRLLKHNYETIDFQERRFNDLKPVSDSEGPIAQMVHDIEDDLKEMDRLTQQAIDRLVRDAVDVKEPALK